MKTLVKKYKSGLTVVVAPRVGAESVTVLALVGVGSRYEEKRTNGISHFLEHMVFKGTNKWPTARDLSMAVDSVGAEFNAFTSKEYTAFYVRAGKEHRELACDVISDMLYAPLIPAEEMEREKGVIVEEINMYNDLPQRRVADVFEKLMYGDVPLGWQIDGEKETVMAFRREDFVTHMDNWYGLNNLVVVVAGGVNGEIPNSKKQDTNIQGIADEVAGVFEGKNKRGNVTMDRNLGVNPENKTKVRVLYKKSDQAHLIVGFPFYKRNSKYRYALSVLEVIMGGNMSSRLFTEVREKRGLAYYARCDVDAYLDTGSITAVEGVDTKRVSEAIKVTLGEFDKLVAGKNRITPEEMQRAKDYVVGNLKLYMESNRNLAQYYGVKQLMDGEVMEAEEVVAKIMAVKLDEIEAMVADKINRDRVHLAVVGPYKDSDEFEKIVMG